jgi:maltose alpha-D-glucosyltransferase/alpha-amylase
MNDAYAGSPADRLWYKDAVVYQLHVKAFYDSNADGTGDFPGLREKLDYLQVLGVTCLWLLPFYPSPQREDGYDVTDHCDVHPTYGTLDDFKSLLAEAHARGLRVILELVLGHTSDQHPWFQRARHSPAGSRERNFYIWSDIEAPNATWDAEAKAYYTHRRSHHEPALNYDNADVLHAMLGVADFWLALGVDGFRIGSVPTVVGPEGGERVAERHLVLRELRRYVDAKYSERLLLVDTSEPPPDVRAWFGDGDEAHMVSYFPLMPRVFLAIHRGDREPITDILKRTPEIRRDCQWALFLRDYDELTLDMVSEDERAYMYLAYTTETKGGPAGIRRRLAPLLGNDRRRIEVLIALLFSLPGTPVIYYGDEIGMGDNRFLGDRDGTRTPMQWTSDRNAGFSRADPARLYAPPIMDPVYGFRGVNVEAQERDRAALLHWIRNMINLRRLFRVFSRGTIEILEPENKRVLAYLRQFGGDAVLCVSNLSHLPQPVLLDLSSFRGFRPVEMLGYTDFPPVEDGPYFLTLGAYGFYWFELQRGG